MKPCAPNNRRDTTVSQRSLTLKGLNSDAGTPDERGANEAVAGASVEKELCRVAH